MRQEEDILQQSTSTLNAKEFYRLMETSRAFRKAVYDRRFSKRAIRPSIDKVKWNLSHTIEEGVWIFKFYSIPRDKEYYGTGKEAGDALQEIYNKLPMTLYKKFLISIYEDKRRHSQFN